jgi:hypothetical protein
METPRPKAGGKHIIEARNWAAQLFEDQWGLE